MTRKFYGQFSPPVDEFIFTRYFPDKNIRGILVECGAFDGETECSGKFFEESMQWEAYNIEPSPWIYSLLCKNRPKSRNLNFALSNRVGTSTFTAVDHPHFGVYCTNGSLSHTEKHKKLLLDLQCKLLDIEVALTTWKDFISSERIEYVDLLVLDVEGHEKEVIEGMQGANVLPDIVCIEVGHLDLFEIRNMLGVLGYVYDTSSHVNAFFIHVSKLSLFEMRAASSQHSKQKAEAETGHPLGNNSDSAAEQERLQNQLKNALSEKERLENELNNALGEKERLENKLNAALNSQDILRRQVSEAIKNLPWH